MDAKQRREYGNQKSREWWQRNKDQTRLRQGPKRPTESQLRAHRCVLGDLKDLSSVVAAARLGVASSVVRRYRLRYKYALERSGV